jgi:ABC-type cobalamin/Fe3+-siderophores transport system ATPase subunit
MLDSGTVKAVGKPSDVLTSKAIRETFGVETTFVPVENEGVHLIFD